VPTEVPAATTVPEIEITVARSEHPFHPLEDDLPVHNAIADRTGIRMHLLKIPGDDWPTKRKVWLSTNQVPDLLHCVKKDIRDYAPQGPLMKLRPLIEQHAPNLQKYVLDNAEVVGKLSIGGELYYIPGLKYNWKLNSPMPMIRMDLLEELGLEAPTDYDELFDVLKEFKAAYPDSVGWSCRLKTRRLLEYSLYPMGSGFPVYFDKDVAGGKWLFGPIHEEFKFGLDWFARAYEAGVLDPDYANIATDEWSEKCSSGEATFYYDNMNIGIRYNAAITKVIPDGWWAPIEILEGQKGRRQWHYSFWWAGWAIGATAEHPERLIKFLDWLVTPEGLDLTNWGIEGEHYVYREGYSRPDEIDDYTPDGVTEALYWERKDLTPEVREKYADASDPQRELSTDIGTGMLDVVAFRDTADSYVWQEKGGPYEAWYELLQADPMLPHGSVYLVPDFTEEESDRIMELTTEIDTVLDPAYDRVIIGETSLSEYDAEAAKIMDKARELEDIYNQAQARI
jgi:putative aldouronate transport system substrate-binding protein